MTKDGDRRGPTGQVALVDALIRTSFLTMAVLSKQAAANDVSLTQLRVLGILRDRRLRMSELADYLGLDRSTITGLVDRLEGRGLLQRAANPTDGRSVDVLLTDEGLRAAEHGAAEISEALAPLVAELDESASSQLASLLEQVIARGPQLSV